MAQLAWAALHTAAASLQQAEAAAVSAKGPRDSLRLSTAGLQRRMLASAAEAAEEPSQEIIMTDAAVEVGTAVPVWPSYKPASASLLVACQVLATGSATLEMHRSATLNSWLSEQSQYRHPATPQSHVSASVEKLLGE